MKTTVVPNPLSTTNLSVGHGHGRPLLLKAQNLSLEAGQLVCFMGPNGIGKSTLIRTLAGLQKPIAGSIQYNSDKELPLQMAVVLTDRITSTELTVYDLIILGRYPYLDWNITLTEFDRHKVDEVIALTCIGSIIEKRVDELSDGQMQLVMIARALVQDCPILLLDEPTAHLDLNNRVEIMNLLRSIAHQQDKAILVATHELDLALQTADKIWLATANQTIVTGMPEDLVLNGAFDETFQFKGFDLKTGKVQHVSYRDVGVALHGEGPELLWTRNALERNGFSIDSKAGISITLTNNSNTLTWRMTKKNTELVFTNLESLIRNL